VFIDIPDTSFDQKSQFNSEKEILSLFQTIKAKNLSSSWFFVVLCPVQLQGIIYSIARTISNHKPVSLYYQKSMGELNVDLNVTTYADRIVPIILIPIGPDNAEFLYQNNG
jgi:hypothetical protein